MTDTRDGVGNKGFGNLPDNEFDVLLREAFQEASNSSPIAPPEGLQAQLLAMADAEAMRGQNRWRMVGIGFGCAIGGWLLCLAATVVAMWQIGLGGTNPASATILGWIGALGVQVAALNLVVSQWISQASWIVQGGLMAARWVGVPLLMAAAWCACGFAVAAVFSGWGGWRNARWR